MPRTPSINPLAQALDKRIRAVVDETMDEAVRAAIREIVQQELANALGTGRTTAAPASIGTRRTAAASGRRAQATAGRKTRAAKAEGASKGCDVAGCKRPYRSQGYCAAHYQAARKYDWPMPAPKNFTPPPRPARGRPPREAAADNE